PRSKNERANIRRPPPVALTLNFLICRREQLTSPARKSPMNDLSRAALPSEIPDLTACDLEPIHLPGAIEPNGAILVLGEDALTILQASSNVVQFFNVAPEALLGLRLTDLFSPD